jgi:hypothetical protein
MVAKLFRAVDAINRRITRKDDNLKVDLSDFSKSVETKAEAATVLAEEDGKVKGAGKELDVVRKSEQTMRALIAAQDSVDERQLSHLQVLMRTRPASLPDHGTTNIGIGSNGCSLNMTS